MLAPVADHQAQSEEKQGEDEDEERCVSVHKAIHAVDEEVVSDLPGSRLETLEDLAFPEEVARKLKPHEEKKSAEVAQKIGQLVSLVPDRRGQIVRPIPFHVMMLDVVVVVRVPRMSHERIGDVGKERVNEPETLG